QMVASPARSLPDLLPAAESVGDDQSALIPASNRRDQRPVPRLHRELVVTPFEAEGAGHSAAARIGYLVLDPHGPQPGNPPPSRSRPSGGNVRAGEPGLPFWEAESSPSSRTRRKGTSASRAGGPGDRGGRGSRARPGTRPRSSARGPR